MWKSKVVSALATSKQAPFNNGDTDSVYSAPGMHSRFNQTNSDRAFSHLGLLPDSTSTVSQPNYLSFNPDSILLDEILDEPPDNFIPVSSRVFLQLAGLVTFLIGNQIQMVAAVHTNTDTLPIRVLFIPLLYFLSILLVTITMLHVDSRNFRHAGYYQLAEHFELYMKLPFVLHALMFSIVGVIFACSTTNSHEDSKLMYIEEKTKETLSIVMWSATHILEVLFWASLTRVCIIHNNMQQGPEWYNVSEKENNAAYIRTQQLQISNFNLQLRVNSVDITNLKFKPRTKTKPETNIKQRLQNQSQEVKTLETENQFLQTSVLNKKAEVAKAAQAVKDIRQTIRELQSDRNKLDRELASHVEKTKEMLKLKKAKEMLVSVSQTQAELQSKYLYEYLHH